MLIVNGNKLVHVPPHYILICTSAAFCFWQESSSSWMSCENERRLSLLSIGHGQSNEIRNSWKKSQTLFCILDLWFYTLNRFWNKPSAIYKPKKRKNYIYKKREKKYGKWKKKLIYILYDKDQFRWSEFKSSKKHMCRSASFVNGLSICIFFSKKTYFYGTDWNTIQTSYTSLDNIFNLSTKHWNFICNYLSIWNILFQLSQK